MPRYHSAVPSRRPRAFAGRAQVTARFRLGATLDLLAQATVIAGFSRVGLTVRSRLLPEFIAAPPPAAGGSC